LADRSFTTLMIRRFRENPFSAAAAVLILGLFLIAIFAPQLAPYGSNDQDYAHVLEPPSVKHWFGTDQLGRDVMSRIIYGSRISLVVSVLAVALGASVGVLVGLLAGYWGGTVDLLVGRVIDILLSFPGILLAMLIAATMQAGMHAVVIAVAVYSVPTFARLSRSAALEVKEREYVEAAKAAGASEMRVIVNHVLLNSFGPILVYATLLLGSAILTAAALSFLGVGVPPPAPEWGAMISSGRGDMRHAPHIVFFPGMAIFVAVLAFNILGDALRDVLDPKSLT